MFGSHYILNPRVRVLWALDHALGLARARPTFAPLAARLADAPAERAASLAEHPFASLFAAAIANLTRHEAPVPDWVLSTGLEGIAQLLGVADGEPELARADGPKGLTLLGESPLLRLLLGDNPTKVAPADGGWAPCLAAGLELLARVSPEQHDRVLANVRFVASFDAPPGLLQSLSVGEWPGFVLLRCANGPVQVGDQLVHETSHQLLDAALARRPGLAESLRAAPAAYSPFFEQPRPCLKVLHGLVSYLEVLRFWRGVLEARPWDAELTAEMAHRRHDHVAGLCREGARAIVATAPDAEWPVWHALLRETAPLFDTLLAEAETRSTSPPPLRERLRAVGLSPIQEAEVLLALAGEKGSRLSVTLPAGRALHAALAPDSVPLFSRQVFVTRAEHLKGSFANLAESTYEYYKAPEGAMVYAYVGAEPRSLRDAVLADQENQAGAWLGIPECCRAFFAASWDEARERYEGDLAALLVERDAPRDPEWQSNPFAMYFGRGLTWHFPCSWRCPATAAAIDRRLAALRGLAPDLADTFAAWQRRPIIWSRTAGIVAAELAADGAIELQTALALEWTGPLRRLCARGPLRHDSRGWVTADGTSLAEILDGEAHVFVWR